MSFKLRSSAFRTAVLAGAAIGAVAAQPAFAQSAGGVTADYNPDYANTRITINPPVFDIADFDLDFLRNNPGVPSLLPSVSIDGLAQCNQQLDGPRTVLDLTGAGFELTGLLVETVGALGIFPLEAAAVLTQTGGFLTHTAALGIEAYQVYGGLPECNTEILGGLKVNDGGIFASGNSAIGGALGVGEYLSVVGGITAGGGIEAATVDASGAISAYGGLITLGVVDRIGVQPGISIGGGAIAGAGHLGPESFSLHATSIAIGNLSFASSEGSVAYGTNAESDGFGTVAVGYNSRATADQAVAMGNQAQALAANSVAIGNQASASGGAAVAIGYLNSASGNGAVAIGDPNVATGNGAVAIGADNTATGDAALALGLNSVATGNGAQAFGLGATATGNGALAYGNGATATGAGAIAIGTGAVANGPGQLALGSSNTIISMPSLTSAASRQAQMGPLSVVTTDPFGNLSSDGGSLAAGSLINRQGTALGIAMQNPDLTGDENSGIAFNWGEFEGAEAFSLSGAIVVGRNIFGDNKPGRVTISGSLGVAGAVNDPMYRLRVKESVATRIGGQITW